MNDSSIQSNGEDTESKPSNELTERLLRRATKPVGVIDTFQPQRQYRRTTDWLAQRFSLLDRWKSRYAITDDAAESASLVFAKSQQPQVTMPAQSAGQTFSQTRRDQGDIPASIDAGLSRAARPSIASEVSEALASTSSPPAQFRVSRRPSKVRSGDAIPEADAIDTIHNISSDSLSRSVASGNLPYQNIASHRDGQNHPSRSATGRVGDHFDIKTSEISTDSVGISGHHDAPSSSSALSTQPPDSLMKSDRASSRSQPRAVEIRAESLSSLPDTRLQLQHSEKVAPLARSREISNPPAHPIAAEVIQRASAPSPTNEQSMFFGRSENTLSRLGASSEERTMFSDEVGSSVGSADSFAERGRIESAQPSADLPLSTPPVQRQPVMSSRADETASSGVRRSAEIPVASSQEKATMVWRQAAHGSSPGGGSGITDNARNGLPLGLASSGVSLARQSASVQPASSGTSTNTEVAPPMAASSANQIDIAGVAEQVWRLISRRLEVERERRGR